MKSIAVRECHAFGTPLVALSPGIDIPRMAISAAVESSSVEGQTDAVQVWILTSIVCSLMVLSSWFNPFPLLPDGHGGYSDIRNSMLFDAGLVTAFLTVGLAIFGRGRSRLLLAASGIVLAFVAFAALLSNGV